MEDIKLTTGQRMALERCYMLAVNATPKKKQSTIYDLVGSGTTRPTMEKLEALGLVRIAGFYVRHFGAAERRTYNRRYIITRKGFTLAQELFGPYAPHRRKFLERQARNQAYQNRKERARKLTDKMVWNHIALSTPASLVTGVVVDSYGSKRWHVTIGTAHAVLKWSPAETTIAFKDGQSFTLDQMTEVLEEAGQLRVLGLTLPGVMANAPKLG